LDARADFYIKSKMLHIFTSDSQHAVLNIDRRLYTLQCIKIQSYYDI